MDSSKPFDAINREIVSCRACPRLVEWRERIAAEKKRSFAEEVYWGRPVPNFGDPNADRLIVGLAPAAHGANRTGRMFTGDRSGEWLYRALWKAGVANQAEARAANDGLRLEGVTITAIAHCAPPVNKPTPEEIRHCSRFLGQTLALRHWKAILCLGSIAWSHSWKALGEPCPRFGHGVIGVSRNGTKLVGSYHPSQQNTFTGKLTEEMLDQAIREFLT